MREVTELFDHYREVARSVWNTGFWSEVDLRGWDSYERFQRIKALLFDALVIARIPETNVKAENFRVVVGSGPVPILISHPREGDRNWYWDDPLRQVSSSEAELRFIDFFDWNNLGYIDFRYYRVEIIAWPSHPHVVGRHALIEHDHAAVFVALS